MQKSKEKKLKSWHKLNLGPIFKWNVLEAEEIFPGLVYTTINLHYTCHSLQLWQQRDGDAAPVLFPKPAGHKKSIQHSKNKERTSYVLSTFYCIL